MFSLREPLWLSFSDSHYEAWKLVSSAFPQWLLDLRWKDQGQPIAVQPSPAVQLRVYRVYISWWPLSSTKGKKPGTKWEREQSTFTDGWGDTQVLPEGWFLKTHWLWRYSTPSFWLNYKNGRIDFIETKVHQAEGQRTSINFDNFWLRASLHNRRVPSKHVSVLALKEL